MRVRSLITGDPHAQQSRFTGRTHTCPCDSHTLPHTRVRVHMLTHAHTLTPLTYTSAHSHTLTYAHTRSDALIHAHTISHAHTRLHMLMQAHTRPHMLRHTHPHAHAPSLTLTHAHTRSCKLTGSHTLTLAHTHVQEAAYEKSKLMRSVIPHHILAYLRNSKVCACI